MQKRKRIAWPLAGVALAGWMLYHRWQETFHTVRVESVVLDNVEGTPRQGKRVRVQSVFNAPPDVIWAKVTQPALLTYVASPLITFEQRDGAPLPKMWHEGDVLHANLLGLGCIPLGPHTIHIERIDAARREIQSRENGRIAEIWWHFISVADYAGGRTLYTDEIDIYAGPLTDIVAGFARFFYCYRQTRWRDVVQGAIPDDGIVSTV